MKKVLSIAGSDCSGGAGIQADLKTFSAHGVFGMTAIASVVAENTFRVIEFQNVRPDIIEKQIDAVFEDIPPDAVKVGMLSCREGMLAAAGKLREWQARNVVVDPVMYAKNGCALMEPDSIDTLIAEVVPLADVLTPNIPEAEKISGISILTRDDMIKAAHLIHKMGCRAVLIIPSMIEAGKAAGEVGVPIIFDPVGVGASRLRNETAVRILEEVDINVLCGNISEVRFHSGRHSKTKGVDASEHDIQNPENAVLIAKSLAARLDSIVAVTGAVDVVTDGKRAVCIENGHLMLSNITGTGCMCSSLIASFCGAAPNRLLEATVTALLTMGIAGEIAHTEAGQQGNGSFRMALHDAVSRMDSDTLMRRAKLYEA